MDTNGTTNQTGITGPEGQVGPDLVSILKTLVFNWQSEKATSAKK